MTQINSFKQLEQVLLQKIADALNEVAQKAEKLLKEHVETDVYDVGTGIGREHYYDSSKKPTGQLRDSVVHSNPEVKGGEITAKVYHDKDLMEFEPDTYLHGSHYFSPEDVREMLPYFIDSGSTGSIFGPKWKGLMRPYFSNTKKEIEEGLLTKWWVEALNKRGIQVNVGVSIK